MRASILLWVLSTPLASAQNIRLPKSGPNKPGIGDSPEALQVSEAAGRQPNASSSVAFTRTYNNTPETWTWRVNISEFAAPNNIDDLGSPEANFSLGLHVANTQWQLEWPSDDDSLQSFLEKRNTSITFTALVSNKPSNITDRYNDEDGGNCTSILGDQCTQSLTQAASKESTINLLNLEGCSDTLTVNDGDSDDGAGFSIDPVRPDSNDTNTPLLHRNNTLFFRTSKTYGADSPELARSKRALQVLVMSFKRKGGELGDTSGSTVLCRVVDKAADPQPSGAMGWLQPTISLWGLVLVSTLAML